MAELLEQLYNGEIYPAEQIVPENPEYRATNHRIEQEKQHLSGVLQQEDIQHLERLEALSLNAESMTCYAGFAYGFQLGAQLMQEVLRDPKNSPFNRK